MGLALPPESCKIYTPAPLARAMVAALGDKPHFQWLEPSHGRGAFVEAMADNKIGRARITAIDLDPTPAAADRLANSFRGVDFLRWASTTACRFDRIVGNPPYVAISQLPTSLRRCASLVRDPTGRPIGLGANVWYAFVLTSIRLLRPGGSLAFVLPSAAEFADYAAAVRHTVQAQFGRLELYRCRRPLFALVQEGNLVVVAKEFQAGPFRIVRRRFATPGKLVSALSASGEGNGRPCQPETGSRDAGMVEFRDIATVRLGGVTGDARYFLMDEQRRRDLGIPTTAVVPVVSRARHLRSGSIDQAEWKKLRAEGERVWLFSPSQAACVHPEVKKYLRRRVGGCNRAAFKVSNRRPWYRTPLPSHPHAFLSGMARFGPWLCINEKPKLNATNTLYVVTFRNCSGDDRFRYALSFLTSSVREQLRRTGRRYADGLVKHEPSALAGLRLPQMRDGMDFRNTYSKALDALLQGNHREAMKIADSATAPKVVECSLKGTDEAPPTGVLSSAA